MSQSGIYGAGGGGGGGTLSTLTGNVGGAVSPAGANINLIGGGGVTVTGNPGTHTLTITSAGGGDITFDTDGTPAVSAGGVIHIEGDTVNISTNGATNVVTVSLANSPLISGLVTAGTGFSATTGDVAIVAGNLDLPITNAALTQGVITLGGAPFIHFFGNDGGGNYNVFIGNSSGNGTLTNGTACQNVGVGPNTLKALTTGADNNAVGLDALQNVTSGSLNQGFGLECGFTLSTGSSNTMIGQQAMLFSNGSFNLAIGAYQAAVNWAGTESNNICIGSPGVAGDNNFIRIGDQGAGAHQQNACAIAGIYGVAPGGGGLQMVTIDNTGQLGSSSNLQLPLTDNALTVGMIESGGTPIMQFYSPDGTGQLNMFMGFGAANGGGVITGADNNVAIGNSTMQLLTSGDSNIAIGNAALNGVTTGTTNIAIGAVSSVVLSTGAFNTGVGPNTLQSLISGSLNVALGASAGSAFSGAESDNILISNIGNPGDNNIIRIGTQGAGPGQQNACNIAGIFGSTVDVGSGIPVVVDNTGLLGTIVSSKRFKDNINDMGDRSARLMDLRPVSFSYTKDASHSVQCGLIAEEVHEIMPELVSYDADRTPYSVKYNDIPAMLLNEVQKLSKRVAELEGHIAAKAKTASDLRAKLTKSAAGE